MAIGHLVERTGRGARVLATEGAALLAGDGYPLVLLMGDLCRLLRIHPNTLYQRIAAGDVPKYRRTGTGPRARYEWLRPDVERWLTNRPG